MSAFDLIISGGTIVDGNGGAPFTGDIAVTGGRIVAIAEKISGVAAERLDAAGHIVTPGWIDIHTHFDGQVTWDDAMEPSSSHGVTTIVMGNCGVGFAPVRPGDGPKLIDLMEGVEDIPGSALSEGIPWGAWETYAEYIAFLSTRSYSLDIGSQIPHGSLRTYVMGERAKDQIATADDIEAMARLVKEGMEAGALGFSSSRIFTHRAMSGYPVPGTYADEFELGEICKAMASTGAGIFQLIPGGAAGEAPQMGPDPHTTSEEIAMMARMSRLTGRPVTFTVVQLPSKPDDWRRALELTDEENDAGAQLFPQISARQPGVIIGLSSYHYFQQRESYLPLSKLPLAERVYEMKKPEVKAAILADRDLFDAENSGSMANLIPAILAPVIGHLYSIDRDFDYEPDVSKSVAGISRQRGESEESVLYDMLLMNEGHKFLVLCAYNYVSNDHTAIYEMLTHKATLMGLGDAGAHVRFICDASIPTFALSHWVRSRSRGPRLPLEFIVSKQTARNADVYEMHDRGRLQVGKRADINVIDMDAVGLGFPVLRADLPGGASRLLQAAKGYRATFVNGVMTRENDQDTGRRPGRLMLGAAVRRRIEMSRFSCAPL